ncbi:putative signal transducing protein [Dyadobacter psychrotolerans]|uniref:DUF2007 domain-containing protein n=1 Tax=Dyadobacter psychrotolerans TaxID=2541721 RepID=A0A4R5DH11_9BACT|nr:DUF2007 domain-containing protein [Dyadobacter psychrotolerans]TDE13332.1 DUF2007 domain-containing protein [Dyadobacter psychrotolerans]
MEESWAKAFQSEQMIQAELAREVLDQSGIAAVIVNKKDSSYPIFGMCEVHVLASDLAQAQTILADAEAFRQS